MDPTSAKTSESAPALPLLFPRLVKMASQLVIDWATTSLAQSPRQLAQPPDDTVFLYSLQSFGIAQFCVMHEVTSVDSDEQVSKLVVDHVAYTALQPSIEFATASLAQ